MAGFFQDNFRNIGFGVRIFFRNPKSAISLLNRSNVSAVLSSLRKYGPSETLYRIGTTLKPLSESPRPLMVPVPVVDHDNPETLEVPFSEFPTVSIIVPVHNQFDYTYGCIKSIIENTKSISYEIIIGDDCSTDRTQDSEDVFRGVTIVHNESNLGFTLNCNNAATHARGRYLLFLNNDTYVMPGWLDSLVELIESDDSIGMVGSKFLYPDGLVQEAGGIIWSDASGWNYGRGRDPNLPEFNYVKDVSYITGACIMIRASLWEEIGGFDKRYAPAYCEDSDLAFEVREHGKRVVYQPRSEVIHFEGMSHGKSISTGVKAYQSVNKEKFREKWKDRLDEDAFEPGVDLFFARDCSRGRPTILVIDHQIPTYDMDAGSRNVDHHLMAFVELGFNVKLLPANFHYNEPYARRYQDMGIEVLYGSEMMQGWKRWLRFNGAYIDDVYILRPDVASLFMKYIKKYCVNAKIYYGTCDLHHVRLRRQFELTGNKRCLEESERVKVKEFRAMDAADYVISLSVEETDLINRHFGSDKAVTVPIVYYEPADIGPRSYDNVQDLVFVGGFNHTPNVDGVHWFVDEVWPLIKSSLPGIRFHIVGSNPPESVTSLASDDIVVHGYVTDDELRDLYRDCSVCVIPLRFGAGIKGKTVEAMYNKIPVVSTSIGAEGLPGIDDYISVVDEPQRFAEEVIRLYSDPSEADRVASRYPEYIGENFSKERIVKIWTSILKMEPGASR